jgi:hypothetical protein
MLTEQASWCASDCAAEVQHDMVRGQDYGLMHGFVCLCGQLQGLCGQVWGFVCVVKCRGMFVCLA